MTTRTFDDLPDGEQTEFLDRSTSLQDLSEFTRRLNALSWVSAASMSPKRCRAAKFRVDRMPVKRKSSRGRRSSYRCWLFQTVNGLFAQPLSL